MMSSQLKQQGKCDVSSCKNKCVPFYFYTFLLLLICSLYVKGCFGSGDTVIEKKLENPERRVELFYSGNKGLCRYVESYFNTKYLDRDLNTATARLRDKTPDLFGHVQWEYFDGLLGVTKALVDINNDGIKEEISNSFHSGRNMLSIYESGANLHVQKKNFLSFLNSTKNDSFIVSAPGSGHSYFFRKLYKPDENGKYHIDLDQDPHMWVHRNAQIFKYENRFYILLVEAFEEPFADGQKRYNRDIGYLAVIEMVDDVMDDGVEASFNNLTRSMFHNFSDRCYLKRYF